MKNTITINLVLPEDFIQAFTEKYGSDSRESLELELEYVFTNELQNLVDAIRNYQY